MRHYHRWVTAAAAFAAVALTLPAVAAAGNGHGNGPKGDTIDVGADAGKRGKLKVDKKSKPATPVLSTAAVAAADALASPPVGTQKIWPVINFVTGGARLETMTLRAVGEKSEIWVSNNLN